MLPTIDISLIGVLLAVWNVIKIVWDYTAKAFQWIMSQALTLLIGSKFWATATFLVAAGVLIGFISTFLDRVVNYVLSLTFQSITLDSDILSLLGLYISYDSLVSAITFSFSCWSVYRIVLGMDFTRRAFVGFFTLLSRAWKT